MKSKKFISLLLTSLFLIACDKSERGKTVVPNNDISTCDHVWGPWELIDEPTCVSKGAKERHCNLCGNVETGDVDPDPTYGHKLIYHGELLPSYFNDGNKEYYSCQYCNGVFNLNGIQIYQNEHILEKAGDDMSLSINGVEKAAFTLVSKNLTNKLVKWKCEDIFLKSTDKITLNKTGRVNQEYAFCYDTQVLSNGTYDVFLTATVDGFNMSFELKSQSATLVAKINGQRYLLDNVTYNNSTVETYIYGYHNFQAGDVLIIEDEKANKQYNYLYLDNNTKWNVYDFHKGSNNEIIFDVAGRYGIEFSRGGNNKISITKTFGPYYDGFCKLLGSDGKTENFEKRTFTPDQEVYKDIAWYINHSCVKNADDIKAAIKNGITLFTGIFTIPANDKFVLNVGNDTTSSIVDASHLTCLEVDQGKITIENDYIKVNVRDSYTVVYMPACNSIFIYSGNSNNPFANDVYAVFKNKETLTLTPDSNNNIYISNRHFDYEDFIVLFKINGTEADFLNVNIATGSDTNAVSVIDIEGKPYIFILTPGVYDITYNITTGTLSFTYVKDVALDPSHNLEIKLNYNENGEIKRVTMVRASGSTVATLNNVNLPSGAYILSVSVIDYTIYETYQFTEFSSGISSSILNIIDLGGDTKMNLIVKTGNYNFTFDLTTRLIFMYENS